MGKYRRPLFKSIFLSCLTLVFVLTIIISYIGYSWFKYGMLAQYQSYTSDIIMLVTRYIDLDDINDCLATQTESEKFKSFLNFLDTLRQTHEIDSIVISRPVKENDGYEVINIATGLLEKQRSGEDKRPGIEIPGLGDKFGYFFSPDYLPVIYNNFISNDKIVYTIAPSTFGSSYVASYTIRDKKGEPSVFITTGIPMTSLSAVMSKYLVSVVVTAILASLAALVILLLWTKKRILVPLNSIEDSAREFEERCRSETDPDKIVLAIPEIKTGDELESLAVTLTQMSANIKKYMSDLIKSAVKMNNLEHDLDETNKKAEQLAEVATKDSLTGIRNKTAYDEEVELVIKELKNGNKKFGVVMIDLNYLKKINDTCGHEKGNAAIIRLCKLVCVIFAHSPVFRIGGDEFVVILRNYDYDNVEEHVAEFNSDIERLSDNVSLPIWEKTSAALGYALFDEKVDSCYDDVFRRADMAMYERKKEMKASREE